ncbi:DUF2017 domain-containing protein [Actinomadura alba]|uniref:DUF2017 domain-containing protein n=1 Tax=Actinomadura alba TaxID=406431 RepID=A0ABR7LM76_9ACTN|nr:DUF2017 domain-containing protein [Actinomadura alba]MBC6465950.1 DUF2017 domain-containing protein [Actinomadura alba]
MSTGFERAGKGVRLRLEAEEVAIVRTLVEQLVALVDERPAGEGELAGFGIAEDAEKPDDPVLARLFPDAYREDADAAKEFRRYTEAGLRDRKRLDAGVVLDGLRPGEITLDDDQAHAWLRVLNDVRLALGTRLDITEEFYDRLDRLDISDPRYPTFAVYDWLTVLQESLVRALW